MTQPHPFPVDDHDQALVANVHPPAWPAPRPAERYNLVAIGGGAAGLVSSLGTAGLGGRTAIVERNLMGGDCLVTGCVPSKALLRAAHAAHEARHAERFGVRVAGVEVDFPAVMARMRRERARISEHDAASRLADAGVDVFFGAARFTGPDTLEVDGQTLRFARAVIATGGAPVRPPIPGIDADGVVTSEELWNLTELPRRLAVVGAGAIGCELAQAFRRLGSEVVILERQPRGLPRYEVEASAVLRRRLTAEGVVLRFGAEVVAFESDPAGHRVVVFEADGQTERLAADLVLVAAGRRPRLEGLALDAAGIATDAAGRLVLDGRLRTSNPRVYAAGDAAGLHQFTHAADAMARLVIRNALFFGRGRVRDLAIPAVSYTDPEVAQVGVTEALTEGLQAVTVPLTSNDRAILDGDEEGFARIVHDARGRIRGATIVGAHAGELIASVALLMTAGGTMGHLANTVLAYPTRAEVLKRAGDTYNRGRLTPLVARALSSWLRWLR